MFRRLTARFEDRDSFSRALADEIARGGLFLPTDEDFSPRELIEVALDLPFCDSVRVYQAEVVNRVRGRTETGARSGVAAQLLIPASDLRSELAALAGLPAPAPPPESWPDRDGPARRHERAPACLDAWLEGAGMSTPARTINLSRGGALVEADVEPPEIGERLQLRVAHPRTGEPLKVTAAVLRCEPGENGEGSQRLALRFSDEEAESDTFAAGIEDRCAAAHAVELGGVRGSLSAMSVGTLVQMLAPTADSGTLTVDAGAERRALLLFEGGLVRLVRCGGSAGAKALARVLGWTEGEFNYVPTMRAGEGEGEPMPVEMILLEAARQQDDMARIQRGGLRRETTVRVTGRPCDGVAKLAVGLLATGTLCATVAEWLDAVPDPDAEIWSALLELIEAGAAQSEAP